MKVVVTDYSFDVEYSNMTQTYEFEHYFYFQIILIIFKNLYEFVTKLKQERCSQSNHSGGKSEK